MNKRTKALDISKSVKQKVYERDGGCCVLCGHTGSPNAHFIPRSQGGRGIEENVVTLCQSCHRAYDQSPARPYLKKEIMEYLRSKYPHWDDVRLTYRKGD